jgi:hypothetical protein
MARAVRFTTSPAAARRRWWRPDPATDPDAEAALLLDEVLAAAGSRSGRCDRPGVRPVARVGVPVRSVVGTVARQGDFDRAFRPMRPALRERWESTAGHLLSGAAMAPVSLARVGELYFVFDGHHRVSVARALGEDTVPAVVRAICTTALVNAGLTRAGLRLKAGEREFLRSVPLPDSATSQLRLDRPEDYPVLVSAATDWCVARGLAAPGPDSQLDGDAATAWWRGAVLPVARRDGVDGAGRDAAAAYLAAYLAAFLSD